MLRAYFGRCREQPGVLGTWAVVPVQSLVSQSKFVLVESTQLTGKRGCLGAAPRSFQISLLSLSLLQRMSWLFCISFACHLSRWEPVGMWAHGWQLTASPTGFSLVFGVEDVCLRWFAVTYQEELPWEYDWANTRIGGCCLHFRVLVCLPPEYCCCSAFSFLPS